MHGMSNNVKKNKFYSHFTLGKTAFILGALLRSDEALCSSYVLLPTYSSKEQQSHVEDTGKDGTKNDAPDNL